ncbi:MAG: DUF5777 family beta-barrel protein [Paludibacter sp.]|nr:DUF5777 family beta-barrel protein [Paludibacter sp.]
MKSVKAFVSILIFSLYSTIAIAGQVKVQKAPTDTTSKEINYTEETFFSNRVVNGQSTEGIAQNRLDFRVEHRFGLISDGYYQFFGLDQAFTFFGLEYGIKDWWMVGINRSWTDKTVEGYTKLSLLRQCTGSKNVPLSVSLMVGTSVIGIKYNDPVRNNDFNARVSYTTQILVARKFSDTFSAQLSPVWIHRNIIPSVTDNNDLFALGIAARYRLTPTLSLNGEYYPVINPSEYQKKNYKNSLSFGFDIETAGHVFGIVLSNSNDMIEKNFVGETTGNWMKGNIHLGFNILRKFDL